MNIALINASPQPLKSTSGVLLGELKNLFPAGCDTKPFSIHTPHISEADLAALRPFDAWVFAFPLYVDAVPSHLLAAMRQIETSGALDKGIRVYAIVNLGFYEGRQAQNALAVMENWCARSQLSWCGGIGFGGGGALASMQSVPLGHGPKASLGKALSLFSAAIQSDSALENIYASINFPKFLYKWAAEAGWRKMIKANGGSKKDLNKEL